MPALLDSIPAPILAKLDDLVHQYRDLDTKLADPGVLTDHRAVRDISIKKASLEGVVTAYREFRRLLNEANDLRTVIAAGAGRSGQERELAELAQAELPDVEARAAALLADVKTRLVNAEDRKV